MSGYLSHTTLYSQIDYLFMQSRSADPQVNQEVHGELLVIAVILVVILVRRLDYYNLVCMSVNSDKGVNF